MGSINGAAAIFVFISALLILIGGGLYIYNNASAWSGQSNFISIERWAILFAFLSSVVGLGFIAYGSYKQKMA